MDAEKIVVTDELGNEVEYEILFTFENDSTGKSYVLYFNEAAEDGVVYASIYDDAGNLFEIEDPDEWDMVHEVFNSFSEEDDDDVEDENENKEHECDCCEGDDCDCEDK